MLTDLEGTGGSDAARVGANARGGAVSCACERRPGTFCERKRRSESQIRNFDILHLLVRHVVILSHVISVYRHHNLVRHTSLCTLL